MADEENESTTEGEDITDGARSADLIADLQQTLAVLFERLLSTPRKTVASALDGGQHRKSGDDLRSGTEAHRTTSERGKTSYDVRGTRNAVDANDEPDIYPDPCLLSAGGQKTHTGRLDPPTEKCDNARVAGVDRSMTGQNEAAGPRRDEFHTNSAKLANNSAKSANNSAKSAKSACGVVA